MIDGQFDVIFRGQIMKTFELSDVKSNLVNLFKSSPEAVEKLFTGDEVVIKKGLDYTKAMKYQSALKKAGALALIKEVETKESASEQTNASQTQSIAPNETNQITHSENKVSEPSPDNDSSDFSLAEVGAQIMPDKVYEKRDVDTSALSLAAAGERIMPDKPPEDHPQPSIDHLSLED